MDFDILVWLDQSLTISPLLSPPSLLCPPLKTLPIIKKREQKKVFPLLCWLSSSLQTGCFKLNQQDDPDEQVNSFAYKVLCPEKYQKLKILDIWLIASYSRKCQRHGNKTVIHCQNNISGYLRVLLRSVNVSLSHRHQVMGRIKPQCNKNKSHCVKNHVSWFSRMPASDLMGSRSPVEFFLKEHLCTTPPPPPPTITATDFSSHSAALLLPFLPLLWSRQRRCYPWAASYHGNGPPRAPPPPPLFTFPSSGSKWVGSVSLLLPQFCSMPSWNWNARFPPM